MIDVYTDVVTIQTMYAQTTDLQDAIEPILEDIEII